MTEAKEQSRGNNRILVACDLHKKFRIRDNTGTQSGVGASPDEPELHVVRGVSLALNSSETLSIMGRSGCGKSTLISLLAGLDFPTSGQVELLGRKLDQLPASELNQFRAQNVGIIFQQFYLLDHLTALENVRLPLDLQKQHLSAKAMDERALQMLAKVGLADRASHFPDQLSRGECQRVAIARVLMTNPKLVLADEPTGSLDSRTGQEVIDLIFRLATEQEIALIIVTHDKQVAQLCQRRFQMADGFLKESSE